MEDITNKTEVINMEVMDIIMTNMVTKAEVMVDITNKTEVMVDITNKTEVINMEVMDIIMTNMVTKAEVMVVDIIDKKTEESMNLCNTLIIYFKLTF